MKILVTGAAGFIGSNFVFHMRKAHPEYDIIPETWRPWRR